MMTSVVQFKIMSFVSIIVFTILMFSVLSNNDHWSAKQPQFSSKDSTKWLISKREGKMVRILPLGFRFEIPAYPIQWHSKFGNNLFFSRKELEKVAMAEGEWDKEFASICNSVFPFDKCAVQIGSCSWGNGSTFSGLQIRVYVLPNPTTKVEKLIEEKGRNEIVRFSSNSPEIKKQKKNGWHFVKLLFPRFYIDYGGIAIFDCRIKQFSNQSVVFVFMYTDNVSRDNEITSILNSIDVKPKE